MASSTAASARGRSTASPTRRRQGERFDWYRARMLGGRTNHWGRISLRFGPDDFQHKSIDGLGDDWPFTYDEIKPYYDNLDRLVGIFGSVEGIHNEPDGVFLPPPKPRCYELLIKQAADQLKITVYSVAAVDPDAAAQRPRAVPLLRPVRPRLCDAFELLVDLRLPSSRAGHRQAEDHHRRDGARSADEHRGPGDRRLVRQHEGRARVLGAREGRGAGGQRRRVGAADVQLEVAASSRTGCRTRAACSAST